jgi:lipoate-protein ligase A
VPLFELLEVFSDDVARSAAMNMALDEVLWQSSTLPRLRFYQWDHPALSFGYFGEYAEVAPYRSERALVRRCTGGGIVFHGSDLTYALVIPTGSLTDHQTSPFIYGRVHEAVQSTLREIGVPAVLVSDANPKWQPSSTSCFANPVPADVLVNDQKVAGAAQRRSRRGLLQQGSIQNIQLPNDFGERFAGALAAKVVSSRIDSGALEEARRLAETKYQSESWLKRR